MSNLIAFPASQPANVWISDDPEGFQIRSRSIDTDHNTYEIEQRPWDRDGDVHISRKTVPYRSRMNGVQIYAGKALIDLLFSLDDKRAADIVISLFDAYDNGMESGVYDGKRQLEDDIKTGRKIVRTRKGKKEIVDA